MIDRKNLALSMAAVGEVAAEVLLFLMSDADDWGHIDDGFFVNMDWGNI